MCAMHSDRRAGRPEAVREWFQRVRIVLKGDRGASALVGYHARTDGEMRAGCAVPSLVTLLEAHLGAAGAAPPAAPSNIHGFVVTFAPAADTVHQVPPK